MPQTVEAIVDGGKASAGPPLGPALGPTGLNMGQVIAAINEKTADFKGMKVPIKIIIGDKKDFTITVGTPPASELVKQKAGVPKGSGNAKADLVGNISLDDAMTVARMKFDDLLGGDLKAKTKEVVGTCVSMGIKVENEDPRAFIKKIAAGDFDDRF